AALFAEFANLGGGLLARRERAVAVARVRGEQLRSRARIGALEVRALAALLGQALEQLGGLGGAPHVEQRQGVRELEGAVLGALEHARIAGRLLEVGGSLGGLALAHHAPAVAEQREREVALGRVG